MFFISFTFPVKSFHFFSFSLHVVFLFQFFSFPLTFLAFLGFFLFVSNFYLSLHGKAALNPGSGHFLFFTSFNFLSFSCHFLPLSFHIFSLSFHAPVMSFHFPFLSTRPFVSYFRFLLLLFVSIFTVKTPDKAALKPIFAGSFHFLFFLSGPSFSFRFPFMSLFFFLILFVSSYVRCIRFLAFPFVSNVLVVKTADMAALNSSHCHFPFIFLSFPFIFFSFPFMSFLFPSIAVSFPVMFLSCPSSVQFLSLWFWWVANSFEIPLPNRNVSSRAPRSVADSRCSFHFPSFPFVFLQFSSLVFSCAPIVLTMFSFISFCFPLISFHLHSTEPLKHLLEDCPSKKQRFFTVLTTGVSCQDRIWRKKVALQKQRN